MGLREKSKRYSELVKEMFVPRVDKKKREELESLREKPQPRKASFSMIMPLPEDSQFRFSLNVLYADKVKPKAKSTAPVSPVKPRVDYLTQRRQERASVEKKLVDGYSISSPLKSLTDKKDLAQIKERSRQLEQVARRHELIAKSVSPTQALRLVTEVNDMLLESIKAKFALL